ncbi:MAG: acyl-CoA desaturase [Pseudomonadota bacterium]
MHADYANPRIDGHDKDADAVAGAVYADPAKVVWVGAMAVLGIVGAALTMTTGAVVLFVVSTAVTLCLGHSLGMHRRFIHKSYRCPKWLEYLFVHFGVLVGLAGPFGMLRTHDLRDWAQRQVACHPYFSHASRWHKDLLWQLFFSIRLERPPRIDIDADYASDPVYRVMERTWHFQQLPWAILFYAIGGWGWVAWGIGSRVTVSIFGHWLIGYFAHNEGERRWHVDGAAVQGHNVRWTALLTMGECWHNNHHAFPGSARLGLEPDQWDPGWWVLQGMEHVGLARDFVLPEQLRPRAELVDLAKTLR